MNLLSRTIATVLLACASLHAAGTACEDLSALKLVDTVLSISQTVAAGEFHPPTGSASAFRKLPEFCRVAGSIKPFPDSNIQFEVWMPSSGWNGKFSGAGNGGFAGMIPYSSLALPLSRGYAVAATDTGHTGGDASWALGHPQKVVDFGDRAIHETAIKAKAVVRAFYGEYPRKSYFSSCSNGGRQALMEAQRYPADYDGIIAGAPANFWTHHFSGFAWNILAQSDPASHIPPVKLKAIEVAALAACDARDGVVDGVLDDPPKCHFDPSVLLCKETESDSCLTAPQLEALRKIYQGPRTSRGVQVFPGYVPGGETGGGGWNLWITANKSAQYMFATQFFSNMVFEDPAWDYKTFNVDRDVQVADSKTDRTLNSTSPNLKEFKNQGGKLILYHGWSDAAIAPENSINYYNSVVSTMGGREAGQFVRLFMVPGMQHCAGGPGPSNFGQAGAPYEVPADPEHDVSLAIERWVEKGVAPETIVATKPVSDSDRAKGVLRTRPLCAYPLVARWRGSGSTDEAANFSCVKEDFGK